MAQTDTENDAQSVQSNFSPSKKENKSVSKKKESKKSVEKKKGEKKQKPKKQKAAQNKKAPKKKKESKAKSAQGNADNKEFVRDYMEKQNRPYNLLNIFDNLHGKIKKGDLQTILNCLVDEKELTAKEFGKNKVYFLNQQNMKVSIEAVDNLGSEYTEVKTRENQLKETHKNLSDEEKRLLQKKTLSEIEAEIQDLRVKNELLIKKKNRLTGEGNEKIDESIVLKIQNDEKKFKKQLAKRKKLVKEGLSTWAEILQKKVDAVAELMGIQL